MWLKCGVSAGNGHSQAARIHVAFARICCGAQVRWLVLTRNGAGPYNLLIRRADRYRRDGAPLKLLTYVWDKASEN